MTPRMSVFAILTALALAVFGAYALAGSGVHVQAEIEHTQEAIDDGAKGDSKEIVTHVISALGHAREALHEKAIERDRAANYSPLSRGAIRAQTLARDSSASAPLTNAARPTRSCAW